MLSLGSGSDINSHTHVNTCVKVQWEPSLAPLREAMPLATREGAREEKSSWEAGCWREGREGGYLVDRQQL